MSSILSDTTPLAKAVTSITAALGQRTAIAIGAFTLYLAVCRGLRYLRMEQKHRQYPYKRREDFANMTAEHAQQITNYIMSLEFPFTSEKALQFALFRTYGIPSISKLLCQTKQLSDLSFAPRRYVDTRVLISEFTENPPASERANEAIARMNYLHGMYQKSGKISNDDMLYTFSLFVTEIPRWVKNYEWRELTPMEVCAIATLWKSIGTAMDISFAPLAHYPHFRDGLELFNDLETWALDYEARAMVPNDWNHQLAIETTAILLYNLPESLKPAGTHLVSSLMDDRLRKSMIFSEPPKFYTYLLHTILSLRVFLLRYLSPPRPKFLQYTVVSAPDANGRLHMTDYEAEPWYVAATWWQRNKPATWLRWAAGMPYPDGKNYKPEGYRMFEVGPRMYEKMGGSECAGTKERLMGAGRGGCPFAVKA